MKVFVFLQERTALKASVARREVVGGREPLESQVPLVNKETTVFEASMGNEVLPAQQVLAYLVAYDVIALYFMYIDT